jgi:predicted peptidase
MTVTLLLAILLSLAGCGSVVDSTHRHTRQQAYISQAASLKALVYLPDGYKAAPHKRWPLIVYLHGSSQRGDDLSLLIPGSGLPSRIEQGFRPPFIVVSPQCPLAATWLDPSILSRLDRFIQALIPLYRIDPQRINLTGFSIGGDGTWALATAHPDRFASVAPVGAYNDHPNVTALKATPTWVFHGENDAVCPIANDVAMVERLQKAGNTKVKITVWPNADHGQSRTATYLEQDLYDWFARQRLTKTEKRQ